METPKLTEAQEIKLGQKLVDEFQLTPDKSYLEWRYNLNGGNKTLLGVARTVLRMVEEAAE